MLQHFTMEVSIWKKNDLMYKHRYDIRKRLEREFRFEDNRVLWFERDANN